MMENRIYVPDDHVCACDDCSEDVRRCLADYPITFRVNEIPPLYFDKCTLGDLDCLLVRAFYDGSLGGEPWSLHATQTKSEVENTAPGVHVHPCKCGSRHLCSTVLRGEATKLTLVESEEFKNNPKWQDMYRRLLAVYAARA